MKNFDFFSVMGYFFKKVTRRTYVRYIFFCVSIDSQFGKRFDDYKEERLPESIRGNPRHDPGCDRRESSGIGKSVARRNDNHHL